MENFANLNFRNTEKTTIPSEIGCRTCDDFKSWSKLQTDIYNSKSKRDKNTSSPSNLGTDCPLDKIGLGQSTWGLLHTIGVNYPQNPTSEQKNDVKIFFEKLSKVYPCEYCANDFREDLKKNPVNVSSQHQLSMWLCDFHNRVNTKLNKPLFDCSKVYERWRDGWLDGSCD